MKVPVQELGGERALDIDLMVPQKRGNFPHKTAPRLAAVDAEVSPAGVGLTFLVLSWLRLPPSCPHRHIHTLGN